MRRTTFWSITVLSGLWLVLILPHAAAQGADAITAFIEERDLFAPHVADHYESPEVAASFPAPSPAVARLVRGFERLLRLKREGYPKDHRDRFVIERIHPAAHHRPLDVIASIAVLHHDRTGSYLNDYYVQWLLWRMGVVGRHFRSRSLGAIKKSANVKMASHNVLEGGAMFELDHEQPVRYGLVTTTIDRGRSLQGVLLVRSPVSLSDTPKRIEPGTSVSIAGTVHVPVTVPRLDIGGPDGLVHSEALQLDEDGGFATSFDAPEAEGVYYVEIRGVEAGDAEDVSSIQTIFPIYVGVEEPAAPPEWAYAPPPNPASREDWAAATVEIYNELRADRGLAPIAIRDELSAMAQEWVEQITPTDVEFIPDAVASVQEHGLEVEAVDQSTRVCTNVAACARFELLRPNGAERLLGPEATLIGLGFAPYTAAEGARAFQVYEILAQPGVVEVSPASPEAAPGDAPGEPPGEGGG